MSVVKHLDTAELMAFRKSELSEWTVCSRSYPILAGPHRHNFKRADRELKRRTRSESNGPLFGLLATWFPSGAAVAVVVLMMCGVIR